MPRMQLPPTGRVIEELEDEADVQPPRSASPLARQVVTPEVEELESDTEEQSLAAFVEPTRSSAASDVNAGGSDDEKSDDDADFRSALAAMGPASTAFMPEFKPLDDEQEERPASVVRDVSSRVAPVPIFSTDAADSDGSHYDFGSSVEDDSTSTRTMRAPATQRFGSPVPWLNDNFEAQAGQSWNSPGSASSNYDESDGSDTETVTATPTRDVGGATIAPISEFIKGLRNDSDSDLDGARTPRSIGQRSTPSVESFTPARNASSLNRAGGSDDDRSNSGSSVLGSRRAASLSNSRVPRAQAPSETQTQSGMPFPIPERTSSARSSGANGRAVSPNSSLRTARAQRPSLRNPTAVAGEYLEMESAFANAAASSGSITPPLQSGGRARGLGGRQNSIPLESLKPSNASISTASATSVNGSIALESLAPVDDRIELESLAPSLSSAAPTQRSRRRLQTFDRTLQRSPSSGTTTPRQTDSRRQGAAPASVRQVSATGLDGQESLSSVQRPLPQPTRSRNAASFRGTPLNEQRAEMQRGERTVRTSQPVEREVPAPAQVDAPVDETKKRRRLSTFGFSRSRSTTPPDQTGSSGNRFTSRFNLRTRRAVDTGNSPATPEVTERPARTNFLGRMFGGAAPAPIESATGADSGTSTGQRKERKLSTFLRTRFKRGA
jgi:hypothetical protein